MRFVYLYFNKPFNEENWKIEIKNFSDYSFLIRQINKSVYLLIIIFNESIANPTLIINLSSLNFRFNEQ
jgi:hypothetical protein